jgi:hypothetical protein
VPEFLKDFLFYDKKEEGTKVLWEQLDSGYYDLDKSMCDKSYLSPANLMPIHEMLEKKDKGNFGKQALSSGEKSTDSKVGSRDFFGTANPANGERTFDH